MRRTPEASVLAVAAVLLAACGAEAGPEAVPATSAPVGSVHVPTPGSSGGLTTASGTFMPWDDGATAVTYDPALVPPSASATLTLAPGAAGTGMELVITGLTPGQAYGADLHAAACGAAGEDAGAAAGGAVPPFTADRAGAATVDTTVPGSPAAARSLVIHGGAGEAAPRVACLTLPAGR